MFLYTFKHVLLSLITQTPSLARSIEGTLLPKSPCSLVFLVVEPEKLCAYQLEMKALDSEVDCSIQGTLSIVLFFFSHEFTNLLGWNSHLHEYSIMRPSSLAYLSHSVEKLDIFIKSYTNQRKDA